MNKYVVITRMLYADNDPKFEERLSIYRALCLPRIKKQTIKTDIAVLCNKAHANIFKSLGVIPFFMRDGSVGKKPGRFWSCLTNWDNIEGLDEYDVQINIDSDDLITDNYVWRINKAIEMEKEQSLHIHFQPRIFNFHTFEEKEQNKKYNTKEGSAFYAIYQPNKDNYVYIGQTSHLFMPSLMNKSVLIGEGYCWIGIHDNNDSTTMQC